MSSILLQVYDALEAMTVTYLNRDNVSTTATCYNLEHLPGSVSTALLPCRLLLPLGQGASGSPNLSIEEGAGIRAAWQITDLFLLEAAARGEGLYIHAPVLMRYVVAYADAIAKLWQLVYQSQTMAFTQSVSIIPAMLTYPANTDSVFYGVKVDIQISEVI